MFAILRYGRFLAIPVLFGTYHVRNLQGCLVSRRVQSFCTCLQQHVRRLMPPHAESFSPYLPGPSNYLCFDLLALICGSTQNLVEASWRVLVAESTKRQQVASRMVVAWAPHSHITPRARHLAHARNLCFIAKLRAGPLRPRLQTLNDKRLVPENRGPLLVSLIIRALLFWGL